MNRVEDIGERAWVGIERVAGMPEERDQELGDARRSQCKRRGSAGLWVAVEVNQQRDSDEHCGERGVERYGVQAGSAGRREDAPGERGRQAGIAAFGKVSEREERPCERWRMGAHASRARSSESRRIFR